MDHEIFLQCQVAAIPRAGDAPLYVLFALTAPAGDHHVVGSWSAIAFGTYRDTLYPWFRWAAKCASGGVTTGQRTALTPEQMLDQWRWAFAAPVRFQVGTIDLRIGSDASAPIPSSRASVALDALRRAGYDAVASRLACGGARMRLDDDVGPLLALYGPDGPLADELPFTKPQCGSERVLGLAPRTWLGTVAAPPVTAFRIGDDLSLVRVGTGDWRHGSHSALLAECVRLHAYPLERRARYAGSKMLRLFREQLRAQLALPLGTVVTVKPLVAPEAGQVEAAQQLLGRPWLGGRGKVVGPFSFKTGPETLGWPRLHGTHPLSAFGPADVEWKLPDHATAMEKRRLRGI